MHVQNLHCNSSHGISFGSLGQYVGEVDIAENVYVYNISMNDTTDGARIKVWPGNQAELSGDLQHGGGTGSVKNVTYNTMSIKDVDYAVGISQCYGQRNNTLCNEYPVGLLHSPFLHSAYPEVHKHLLTSFSVQANDFPTLSSRTSKASRPPSM